MISNYFKEKLETFLSKKNLQDNHIERIKAYIKDDGGVDLHCFFDNEELEELGVNFLEETQMLIEHWREARELERKAEILENLESGLRFISKSLK
jgi:hypothetical protein